MLLNIIFLIDKYKYILYPNKIFYLSRHRIASANFHILKYLHRYAVQSINFPKQPGWHGITFCCKNEYTWPNIWLDQLYQLMLMLYNLVDSFFPFVLLIASFLWRPIGVSWKSCQSSILAVARTLQQTLHLRREISTKQFPPQTRTSTQSQVHGRLPLWWVVHSEMF